MILERGHYAAEFARDADDLRKVQAFRARCFHLTVAQDRDDFDKRCAHVLVRHAATGQLVGCFRVLTLHGAEIETSYSARFYDLSALQSFDGPMIEVGRFCLAAGLRDPDLLRVAWGAMTALVDQAGATLLCGCTSFAGTSPAPYAEAFAFLAQHHKAPHRWQPKPRAKLTVQLEAYPQAKATTALRTMPALLRSYLRMGGWVSDHAVVDPEMNTLHVFTAVEVAAIPTTRKRLLRALC